MKKLYDLYDKDRYIGAFTADEISEMIGCREVYVSIAVTKQRKVKRRYFIKATDDYTVSERDWELLDQFDFLTKELRRNT